MVSDTVFDTLHSSSVTDVAVDATGRRLASCSKDGTVRVFTSSADSDCKWEPSAVLEGHTGTVLSVSWAPPAHYASAILSCGEDCQVILWSDFGNGNGWKKVYFTTLATVPWCAAWAPSEYGKMFAVGCASGAVMIFVGKDQQWTHSEFAAHPNSCCSLSWAPSLPAGTLLTAPLESELKENDRPSQSCGMPVAPPRIVTCGGERSVMVWTLCNNEWRSQELILDVEASLQEVAWAPSVGMPFTYIAAGSDEGFVVVWSQDGPAREEWNRKILPQHEDSVTKLSWSLVGTFLLVSCANGTTSMWRESDSSLEWERVCEFSPS